MLFHVSRTCTEKTDAATGESQSHPIAHFSGRAAYVLLGEPGAGKTSLFEAEANNTADGLCISARDFIALNREQWRDKTLFIDGLDEARAWNSNAKTPLDDIRRRLDQLGCKRFRISCRAADWLGATDTKDVMAVSPDQNITVLHLDPLNSDDINQILSNDPRVPDPSGFIEKAAQLSLTGLLTNPQTLGMLITVVSGTGAWPTSKQEVYEVACKQLASEFNKNHAPTQTATFHQLLDAAGFLCAIQIIGNVTGLTENQDLEGRLCLKEITAPNGLPLHLALKTRLFNRPDTTEYSYIHRSVAEYLAARYLAIKIQEGLLLTRVLALTTGFDGGIVGALRGLMAWLAVLSPAARERLVEVDPVGVIVNGDASLFPKPAKSQLYRALIRESMTTGFPNRDWYTTAFAAITTREMTAELSERLNNPGRSEGEQFLLYCLLRGLSYSESITEIKALLLTIMRDNSYWEAIRSNALDAFIHQYPEDLDSFLSLADDIRQGKVEDTENGLMETLLDKLFPLKIAASNIFDYLQRSKNNKVISYHYFWRKTLPERLTDIDLAVILDQLFERGSEFLEGIQEDFIFDTVGQLLIKGLQIHGLNISSERLYRWLSIGIDQYESHKLKLEQCQQIASWIDAHPDCYLTVISEGLKQIQDFANINWEIYKILMRLYGATPAHDIVEWWLNKALSETDIRLGCAYFEQAFVTLYDKRNDSDLSLDYFVNWLEHHPEYLETYQNLTYCVIPEWRLKRADSTKKWANQRHEEQRKNLDYLHEHQAQIAEGSAFPHIFYQLAKAYNHLSRTVGKSREERLSEFLNGDEILINAAKSGLRKILQRTDLPTPDEIFRTAAKNEYYYLRLPFLVCMDTLYQENPAMLGTLSDDLLSNALAFCFTEGASNEAWLKSLCQSKPELVSRLFTDYVTVQLAAKSQFIHGLHNLAYVPAFQNIAKLTVMPLLSNYPVRGYKNHIAHLDSLLKAAITNVDKIELLAMVEKKLACKGMDIAQRIYWFATGLAIEPKIYEAQVKQTVADKSERINHLSRFIIPNFGSDYGRYDFHASTKGMLIEVFGPRCSPHRKTKAHIVGQAENEQEYVYYLLNQLGNTPGEDGTMILAELLSQPNLSAWHNQIQDAQQTQRLNRREALFKHPSAAQVISTLGNQKPANVADLSALAVYCLKQLAPKMHGSNTDSYEHFWNEGDYGKPEKPRYENHCRNYLLERMEPLLSKYDIQVDLEAHQAKNKRADLKLSFIEKGKTYHLPIEIKRDYNDDLWKTIHDQLIPLYTIAPETEGRGLFLVLWFNHGKLRKHPQGLKPPTSPEQLATMLKETMTPQEQKLIEVFVLDVSMR